MSDPLVSLRARAERTVRDALIGAREFARYADLVATSVQGGHPSVNDGLAALDELVAALEAAERESDALKRQRWSNENRAEVAERGHKASAARDFEQRDEIKRLRAAVEAAERERADADLGHAAALGYADRCVQREEAAEARLLAAQQALDVANEVYSGVVSFIGREELDGRIDRLGAALAAVGRVPAQEDKP